MAAARSMQSGTFEQMDKLSAGTLKVNSCVRCIVCVDYNKDSNYAIVATNGRIVTYLAMQYFQCQAVPVPLPGPVTV